MAKMMNFDYHHHQILSIGKLLALALTWHKLSVALKIQQSSTAIWCIEPRGFMLPPTGAIHPPTHGELDPYQKKMYRFLSMFALQFWWIRIHQIRVGCQRKFP